MEKKSKIKFENISLMRKINNGGLQTVQKGSNGAWEMKKM